MYLLLAGLVELTNIGGEIVIRLTILTYYVAAIFTAVAPEWFSTLPHHVALILIGAFATLIFTGLGTLLSWWNWWQRKPT